MATDDALITRDGVMADFWKGEIARRGWVGVLARINAGDTVVEGRLHALGVHQLYLEVGGPALVPVDYDDIRAVERISARVSA